MGRSKEKYRITGVGKDRWGTGAEADRTSGAVAEAEASAVSGAPCSVPRGDMAVPHTSLCQCSSLEGQHCSNGGVA